MNETKRTIISFTLMLTVWHFLVLSIQVELCNFLDRDATFLVLHATLDAHRLTHPTEEQGTLLTCVRGWSQVKIGIAHIALDQQQ